MILKPIRIIAIIAILLVALGGSVYFLKKATVKPAELKIAIPNSSVEQSSSPSNMPQAWHTEHWGSNASAFAYLTTGHTGRHSLKTTITQYTSGDAKWYFDAQKVTPGQTYTFQDYYEADVPTRIVLQMKKSDGTLLYKELKNAPTSEQWKQYQATFTVPDGVSTLTVFHLLSTVGYLITDDYNLQTFVPVGFKQGLISITWDDGFASQYTKALPLEDKYHLPASFFLISGKLDTPFYLTTTQATAIQSAGNELGSHTVTHPHLPTLSVDKIDSELRQSQNVLKQKFGTSFSDFVTPYGEYNDQVITMIKKYYRSHRSVEDGFNAKNNFDIYDIMVQNVYTTTPPSQVAAWVEKAKKDKTWLVLVYHQVDNPGDEYSVTSSDLETELKTIKKSGLPAVTIDQALKVILPQID